MRPSLWPDWLEHVWAKSPDKGEGGQAESLAQHTWYALERLADFARLRPQLPEQVNKENLWHLLYWSIFLHDFGKAMPGFQAMLRGGARWGHRHEVFSLAFLPWLAKSLNKHDLQWVTSAIVSHHRDAEDLQLLYPPPEPGEERILTPQLQMLDTTTILGLWRWITDCSEEWITALGFHTMGVRVLPIPEAKKSCDDVLENGAANIHKYLGSFRLFTRSLNNEAYPFQTALIALRGHLVNADHSASAHAAALPRIIFSANDVIEKRGIKKDQLFAHQQQAANVNGSALLIAPTGSGKTEAALLWAAQQGSNGSPAPRLFYTLPYQASMNAMSLRLQEIFGEKNVGLLHSRGLLALYRQLMEREENPGQALREATHRRDLARLNYPPVRVFSPYQMLKGMYRLKGYEALLTDYHNGLFVFDEIHAYEVRRLAMIIKTIEHLHKYYHARFFVMSATFPSLVKGWLREALEGPVEIFASSDLFHKFQRHVLRVREGELLDASYLDEIAHKAMNGQTVLVVCNLVDRAQETYSALKNRLRDSTIPVELLHGRFNVRDRLRKEKIVRDKTGSGNLEKQPIVLVATQVVEVSLDIDLNTIYSDPAPLEALVQRFGRINRRGKMDGLADVHVFSKPEDGQKIYDSTLVARTLAVLKRENNRPIDESTIGEWLDEIYSGEVAVRWQEEFSRAARDFEEACIQTLRPFAAEPAMEEQFEKMFDGIEVLPECLYGEYLQLREEEPLRASELLVPIQWRRYSILARQGQIIPRDRETPAIVKASYTQELGLTFDQALTQENVRD